MKKKKTKEKKIEDVQEHSQICDRTIDCGCKRCERLREDID